MRQGCKMPRRKILNMDVVAFASAIPGFEITPEDLDFRQRT